MQQDRPQTLDLIDWAFLEAIGFTPSCEHFPAVDSLLNAAGEGSIGDAEKAGRVDPLPSLVIGE